MSMSITYLPSKSVEVPLAVAFSKTVTPGSGTPCSSTTLPLIKTFWEYPLKPTINNNSSIYLLVLIFIKSISRLC